MRKFLYFLPTILLVGCYNEEGYPLDPNEPAIAEVDLSGLEYALDLEHVAIEPVYYEPKGTNIQELVGDKRYIKLIYGKVENISSEDKLAEYLKDRLTNFDWNGRWADRNKLK